MADVLQQIYDFLQAPYNARQAAGEVVTPGAVDWGGIYNTLQAPYEARQGRLAVQAAPGFTAGVLPDPTPVSQLYDIAYDPRYPVSGGFQPGTWGGPPLNNDYGQPPVTMAETNAERMAQRRSGSSAVAAIDDAFSIPHANGTLDAGKSQVRQLPTTLLAFDGNQANGMIPGGGMGGASGASGKVSLASLLGGVGVGGRVLPPIVSSDPGQTDWSVANNGMQGIYGPNDAKYLPNDPRNNPNAKPLPKYAVNTAPGTFNRETGTFNTGMPASGNGLPNILSGAGNMLGGGGLSLLGRLFGGGNSAPDTRQSLIGHIISAITSQPNPQGAAQAGASLVPGIGSIPAPTMPLVDLNKVSPDSPAAGLLAKNGGGLGEGAQVSFRNPASQQRWLTGY